LQYISVGLFIFYPVGGIDTSSPAIVSKSRPYRLSPKPSLRFPVTKKSDLSEVRQFHAH